MESKKKRYDFESKVRVPTMEEICRAAGQFADPPEAKKTEEVKGKGIPGAKEAAERLNNRKNIQNEELLQIRSEMEALANAVVEDEQKKQSEVEEAVEEEAEVKESSAEETTFISEEKQETEQKIAVSAVPESEIKEDLPKTSADKSKT